MSYRKNPGDVFLGIPQRRAGTEVVPGHRKLGGAIREASHLRECHDADVL